MIEYTRRQVDVETHELGTVQVRDVSMLSGVAFINAVSRIADDEFSVLHDSLVPIYKEQLLESVTKQGQPVFDSLEEIESLSFDTFSKLVKILRDGMLVDNGDAEKKS